MLDSPPPARLVLVVDWDESIDAAAEAKEIVEKAREFGEIKTADFQINAPQTLDLTHG